MTPIDDPIDDKRRMMDKFPTGRAPEDGMQAPTSANAAPPHSESELLRSHNGERKGIRVPAGSANLCFPILEYFTAPVSSEYG